MSKLSGQLNGKLCACAAVLVVATLALTTFAATASALPARFWGVVPQSAPSQEQFQRLQRGGVKSVRIPLDWGALQPTKNGAFDWSGIDAIVERAASTGTEVLPFLTGAPRWAVPAAFVPGGGKAKAPAHLPATGATAGAWKRFVKEAVLRYGPGGAFWDAHPALGALPIRAWQIWNEENFKYFVTKPNPAEYGKLVKLSYPAIKGVDPGAQIILGGLFALPKGCRSKAKPKRNYCATDFLDQMYEKTPGIKSKFNGVALHPYSYFYPELAPRVDEFRAVLKENHDAGKGLWITELGWSSQHPTSANLFAKGVNGQATQLKGAFSMLKAKQAKWRLQRVYWFSVDDVEGACNFCDGSGLFGEGFAPKKSWYAYVKFAGGTP